MSIKKLLAMLLAVAMFTVCLAACGGDNSTATNPPATQAPATQAPATQAPATQAPATAEPTEEPAPTETAEDGQSSYILIYKDQNGDPVPGLMANICDADACEPMTTDENGEIHFTKASYAYHIQVLKVPDGYDYDKSEEFYTEETGGTYEFTVTKN